MVFLNIKLSLSKNNKACFWTNLPIGMGKNNTDVAVITTDAFGQILSGPWGGIVYLAEMANKFAILVHAENNHHYSEMAPSNASNKNVTERSSTNVPLSGQ